MRRALGRLAGALLLGFATASSVAAEPFLDVYTGKSFVGNADVRIRQGELGNDFRVGDVSFADDSFSDPPYYGVRAGYFFEGSPWLGLAVDFFHAKMTAETGDTRRFSGTLGGVPIDLSQPMQNVVQAFAITHGVNYVTANALVRYSLLTDAEAFPNGRIQLYAGAGLGPVIAHPETRVQNIARNAGYEVAGLGVQGFVGVRTMLWRYVGLFAQYRFSHSDLTVTVSSGRAKVAENTHHAVGGLTFSFPSF